MDMNKVRKIFGLFDSMPEDERARVSEACLILLRVRDQKTGIELIADERARQMNEEEYDADHDDFHETGQLAIVAAALCTCDTSARVIGPFVDDVGDDEWGLTEKHQEPVRQLAIAGALIAAEIDRIQNRERIARDAAVIADTDRLRK